MPALKWCSEPTCFALRFWLNAVFCLRSSTQVLELEGLRPHMPSVPRHGKAREPHRNVRCVWW